MIPTMLRTRVSIIICIQNLFLNYFIGPIVKIFLEAFDGLSLYLMCVFIVIILIN